MYFKGCIPKTNENLYFTGGHLFVSWGVIRFPQKHSSYDSKWKSEFLWKHSLCIEKTRSKSTCWWKAHNERINIRPFPTGRFGLMSHWRLISSKRHFLKMSNAWNTCFFHEWGRNSSLGGFETGNRRGIERSSCLDYSRGLKSIFLNYVLRFYWFSRVWGPTNALNFSVPLLEEDTHLLLLEEGHLPPATKASFMRKKKNSQ